jgi:germination protein YpeB
MANLNYLSRSAAALADKMAEIEASVIGENMDYDAISAMFDVPDGYWEESIETSAGESSSKEAPNEFLGFEEIFPSSTFNYDGLYSDHLKTVTSPFLDSLDAITEKEAKEKAAAILSCPVEELSLTGDVGTTSMKCYVFTRGQDGATVYITKQGGYLYSYSLNGIATGDISVDEDTAVSSAEAFLAKCGYSNCGRAYWQYQDNLIMLTYVTVNNGVRIYPEEIKVGVSLTDGQVVYCDASRHLISKSNSRDLDIEDGITEEEAVSVISPLLETENVEKAVIQTPGNRDILCYEIYCKAEDAEMVVYINAQTGVEEESLLLTRNEEGYWAK